MEQNKAKDEEKESNIFDDIDLDVKEYIIQMKIN